MKRYLEEYGLIILVVVFVLLFLGFAKNGLSKNVGNNISNSVTMLHENVSDNRKFYLDLNGFLNGTEIQDGNLSNIATCDVYVNGKLVADDVNDYYQAIKVGSKYEIKDIKISSGYQNVGVMDGKKAGKLQGTITKDTRVDLLFVSDGAGFHLDLNGILDGNEIQDGNIAGVATCDIYIDGVKVGNNVTDWWWPTYKTGQMYEVKNIRINNGYKYTGVMNGENEGSLKGTFVDRNIRVDLVFETK